MNALADRTGKALLRFAATRSFHELLKTQRFLLNVQDEEGNTPMHLAIVHANFDVLELLVDVALTIPYQSLVNMRNRRQLTPLLLACKLGECEVCELLLEANADMTLADAGGNTPLHLACARADLRMLKLLLKYVERDATSNGSPAVSLVEATGCMHKTDFRTIGLSIKTSITVVPCS